jgi:hypothetical protein
MRIENTPDSEKEHPRSIASIRRSNITEGRNDGSASSERENHPTSIGSLCRNLLSASEIHLTCSWRAILGQEVVHGEHYLRGIPIAPKTFFEGCPIVAHVEHATKVEHDFSKRPAAQVPFTLNLSNRLLESPVRFTWIWESLESPSSLELMGTCAQTLELDPSEKTDISLEILVTKAGMHNLQNLRFVVHRGTDPDVEEDSTYTLSQQWLIHLVDSSSFPT